MHPAHRPQSITCMQPKACGLGGVRTGVVLALRSWSDARRDRRTTEAAAVLTRTASGRKCAVEREAWSLVQESDFQCVISDWMMPNMTGLELVRKLRAKEEPDYVYFILLTGKTEKSNLIEGMKAGAGDFVTKSFDPDELRVRVRAGERIIGLERSLTSRNQELSTFTSVASHDRASRCARSPLFSSCSSVATRGNWMTKRTSKSALSWMAGNAWTL